MASLVKKKMVSVVSFLSRLSAEAFVVNCVLPFMELLHLNSDPVFSDFMHNNMGFP